MGTQSKQTFTLDTLNWESVEKVKQKIQEKTNVTWHTIKLYYRSQEQKDGGTFRAIPNGAELHMTVSSNFLGGS